MEQMMKPDLWHLYELMLKSRYFEEATHQLWDEGKISGELHLATGEEVEYSKELIPSLSDLLLRDIFNELLTISGIINKKYI